MTIERTKEIKDRLRNIMIFRRLIMTREQKDKILKAIIEDRNYYARECERLIAEEQGKITGADYMLQRFLDIFKTESEENQ